MSGTIHTGREGDVATITIDRPDAGNMLTLDMLGGIAQAFREAGSSDAKVILLRSVGSDFCLGREAKAGGPVPSAMKMRANVTEPILRVYDAIAEAPQPVLCAVQGAAHGFGTALATACDLTIAADVARFKLPEMEKNLPPTLAISAMMARVPRKALTWMVYTMDEIDAARALELNLVSEVVPLQDLDAAVKRVIGTMTARSPEALIAVKDYFRSALTMDARGAREFGGNLLAAVLSSAGK
jgi:enoyl-CoA hydratase/carnithine racemase